MLPGAPGRAVDAALPQVLPLVNLSGGQASTQSWPSAYVLVGQLARQDMPLTNVSAGQLLRHWLTLVYLVAGQLATQVRPST